MDNFDKCKIIFCDGTEMTLAQWQKHYGIDTDHLGKYFKLSEKKISEFTPFTYAAELIILMDAYREDKGKPVRVNSAFRTREKQLKLIAAGERAANISPHEYGMADDADTTSWEETQVEVKRMRKVATVLGYKIRIGWKKYWNEKKSTFFHTDVCPMYFGKGGIYSGRKHPPQWNNSIEW